MTTIDLFRVQADPATGEWIGEPERVGQIDRAEHDGRADTDAQTAHPPRLPLRALPYKDRTLPEFDLDAALA